MATEQRNLLGATTRYWVLLATWVSVEVISLQRFSQSREHEHVVPGI